MARNNEPFPLAGLIDFGMITGIFIALLYTTGWYYAHQYYSCFHLNLAGINIQREDFFLYAFLVFKSHPIPVLLCLSCSVSLYFLLRYFWKKLQTIPARKTGRTIGWLRAAIFITGPCFLFLLFIIFSTLGSKDGQDVFEREKRADFPSYPRVQVRLEEEKQSERSKEWEKGCFRLLLRDKENSFIFLVDGVSERIPTEIIANSRIAEMRMLPSYQTPAGCRR